MSTDELPAFVSWRVTIERPCPVAPGMLRCVIRPVTPRNGQCPEERR